MTSYRGILRKNPLEGGFFELHADNGTVYRLEGTVTQDEGARVEVTGEVPKSSGSFGIHMTSAPTLVLRSIRAILPETPKTR